MSGFKTWYQKNKSGLLFGLGMLITSLIALPYLLLGEGSYVQIHDQLDGEVLNYIYQAKYLFQGDVIPEFMNGMDKAAMTAPAPLGILFYKILPPFAAFAVMHWFCLLVGFAGMFLLCRHFGLRAEVGFVTACIFCYIPFYPVYGLAALGQPMLVYSFLRLAAGEEKSADVRGKTEVLTAHGKLSVGNTDRKMTAGRFILLLCIVLYGAMSSLTLIGYVWVVLVFLSVLVLLALKKRKESIWVFAGTAGLTLVYLLTNLDLLKSVFGGGFETHRSEMVLHATEDLLGKAEELLFTGGSYSPVYSAGILVTAIGFLGIRVFLCGRKGKCKAPQNCGDRHKGPEDRECDKNILILLGLILAGVTLAVMWNSPWVVGIRNSIGGMAAYFQADRIYWTFPFLWMVLLAWVLEGLLLLGEQERNHREEKAVATASAGSIGKYIARIVCVLLILLEGLQVLRDSTLNKNVRLLLLPGYEQVTWESIYIEETFEQIDEVIGSEKEEISVVSLGMYPSVALYNGYICADGYSNNYDLEYKHAFREIIGEELEKSPETRSYFDDWGNRLYMTAQPWGNNSMVEAGKGIPYEDVAFDAEAMKALNIGYLFAAAPVSFSEECAEAFELLEGSPFSEEGGYYEIWVYRVR